MLLQKKHHVLKEKNDKKGYILTLEKYIKLYKENGIIIEKLETTFNEQGQIDVKISGAQAKKKEG